MISQICTFIKWKLIHLLMRMNIIEQDRKNYFVSKIDKNAPWVFISYLAEVFYNLHDKSYLNSHQNKKETIEIVKIFNNLGYNVYIQDYYSGAKLPKLKKVEIVFGIDILFDKACRYYNPKYKIYYGTGAFWRHQNKQIYTITDNFNKQYNSQIPYRRLTNENCSSEIADKILQIGSHYTIATYPEDLRNKITIIHQSSQLTNDTDNVCYSLENEYLYLGSSGPLLKGLSLLVDYFSNHKDNILNVVGPVEDDIYKALKNDLTDNIIFHGYMNVNSEDFKKITDKCNFLVFPSGSEGGCPGSVLTAMKKGLIPIVTPWAAFDEIEEYGYLLKNWDVTSIEQGIEWSHKLSKKEIELRKVKCKRYVSKTYNINRFSEEFYDYFKGILLSDKEM